MLILHKLGKILPTGQHHVKSYVVFPSSLYASRSPDTSYQESVFPYECIANPSYRLWVERDFGENHSVDSAYSLLCSVYQLPQSLYARLAERIEREQAVTSSFDFIRDAKDLGGPKLSWDHLAGQRNEQQIKGMLACTVAKTVPLGADLRA